MHGPNIPLSFQGLEAGSNQSIEITNSIIRSVGIFNQLGVTAMDSTRQHVNIYERTVDAVTEFNNNILKAWTSYWNSQQQQFFRA
ncbi:MAG: hypothetical protein ACJ71D_02660 [Nitrososphaera sp.]